MGKRKIFKKIKRKKLINVKKKKKDEQECANCSAPGREKQRAGERERERDGVRVYIGVNGRERLRDQILWQGPKLPPARYDSERRFTSTRGRMTTWSPGCEG